MCGVVWCGVCGYGKGGGGQSVFAAVAATRMTILADGSVPSEETDLFGATSVGTVGARSLHELWQDVVHQRRRGADGRSGIKTPSRPMRA